MTALRNTASAISLTIFCAYALVVGAAAARTLQPADPVAYGCYNDTNMAGLFCNQHLEAVQQHRELVGASEASLNEAISAIPQSSLPNPACCKALQTWLQDGCRCRADILNLAESAYNANATALKTLSTASSLACGFLATVDACAKGEAGGPTPQEASGAGLGSPGAGSGSAPAPGTAGGTGSSTPQGSEISQGTGFGTAQDSITSAVG